MLSTFPSLLEFVAQLVSAECLGWVQSLVRSSTRSRIVRCSTQNLGVLLNGTEYLLLIASLFDVEEALYFVSSEPHGYRAWPDNHHTKWKPPQIFPLGTPTSMTFERCI